MVGVGRRKAIEGDPAIRRHGAARPDMTTINSTQTALLEAAEELWGIHGFDGVSLRRIIDAAASANAGAIRYYFKNKDGLIHAVLKWRLEQTEQARGAQLAKLFTNESLDISHFLKALLRPVADVRGRCGKHNYAAFLCAFIDAGSLMNSRYDLTDTAPISHEIVKIILSKMPIADQVRKMDRLTQVCHMYWHSLVLYDRGVIGSSFDDKEEFLDDILRMSTSALLA